MKKRFMSLLLAAALTASITACGGTATTQEQTGDAAEEATAAASGESTGAESGSGEADTAENGSNEAGVLQIAEQGMFSAGGTVTDPMPGDYNEKTNWQDDTRSGNTMHVDHANVFYQIPVNDNGNPIVFLHGAGQSRMGWMMTPDGREGWSDGMCRWTMCLRSLRSSRDLPRQRR